MIPNAIPSEVIAVGGVIDPDANGAGTLTSDYVDLGEFESAMAVGFAGTVGSTSDLTFSVVQATSSGGAGVKAISGKAAAILDDSPPTSDVQVVINVRAEELDIANGFRYVAVRLVTGTATSDSGAVIFGCFPRHAPADDNDLASVVEIVN